MNLPENTKGSEGPVFLTLCPSYNSSEGSITVVKVSSLLIDGITQNEHSCIELAGESLSSHYQAKLLLL